MGTKIEKSYFLSYLGSRIFFRLIHFICKPCYFLTAREAEDIEQKLFSSYREMLGNVQQLINPKPFNDVLDMMNEAQRIFIYGIGSSGLAAQELNSI
ncbi:hypothetical protein [Peribacillus sp. SCS-37]|uniref:hypothetical protein n=1 Tax=Paraperibacillus esterisolvens TaxID=3115296 RepID=UPI0039063597